MDKDFIKKLSKMSKEERKKMMDKMIDNYHRTSFDKLRELHGKVMSLVDFISIFDKLELKYFKFPYTRILKETNQNPGAFLNEYIILEISNFYTLAHLEKGVDLPEPPEYWEKLKNFRNAIPAHADKDKNFETYKDLKKFYGLMDNIDIRIILKDFNEYFMKCAKIFEKKSKERSK